MGRTATSLLTIDMLCQALLENYPFFQIWKEDHFYGHRAAVIIAFTK